MPEFKKQETPGKTPIQKSKSSLLCPVPRTGMGDMGWLQGMGYAEQMSRLSARNPPVAGSNVKAPVITGIPGGSASTKGSVSGAVLSGQLSRQSAAGNLDAKGSLLSGDASASAEGSLTASDIHAGLEAKAQANLAEGAIHVNSAVFPLTLGTEQLEAQAYADLKASVGARASGNIQVEVLEGNTVAPKLSAGAEAFVGATGSATVGADIWWQRQDPMTYIQGARVALERYVLPEMDAGQAQRVRDAIGLAEKTGLLAKVAAAIMGNAGRSDLLSFSGTAKGHAGAGAEASLEASLKGGMVRFGIGVGAALGLGGSVEGSIGVAPVDAGRLLLVLLSEGQAVEAQLLQLKDELVEQLQAAVAEVLQWLNDNAQAIDDYLRESNPVQYQNMLDAQVATGQAGQEFLRHPNLGSAANVIGNSIDGLYHTGMVDVSGAVEFTKEKLGIKKPRSHATTSAKVGNGLGGGGGEALVPKKKAGG